jgi:hypothetical protein
MSIRSLLEFNHDYAHEIQAEPEAFLAALRRYQNCAEHEAAEELERFGVRRVSVRHHADKFFIDEREDGFPAKYINRSERTGA